jgi:hypothetical protein
MKETMEKRERSKVQIGWRVFVLSLALISMLLGFAIAMVTNFSCSPKSSGEGYVAYAQDSEQSGEGMVPDSWHGNCYSMVEMIERE